MVVGRRGGEHLTVLMGGHRLGGSRSAWVAMRRKKRCILFATRTRERANDAQDGQQSERKEGGQRQVTAKDSRRAGNYLNERRSLFLSLPSSCRPSRPGQRRQTFSCGRRRRRLTRSKWSLLLLLTPADDDAHRVDRTFTRLGTTDRQGGGCRVCWALTCLAYKWQRGRGT